MGAEGVEGRAECGVVTPGPRKSDSVVSFYFVLLCFVFLCNFLWPVALLSLGAFLGVLYFLLLFITFLAEGGTRVPPLSPLFGEGRRTGKG